ncbi:butyryl-CoA:acetate CoA-transferase [Eubacteriales bacterium OttesenSCG-928-K08]|nr:butyryl-CoA:acetate CoA-transferase [Eubacteriales bacterium OttesenSCG-928-K08]
MTIRQEYEQKLRPADQIASMVQHNFCMYWGLGYGSVVDIDIALSKRINELNGVEIFFSVPLREKPFESWAVCKDSEHVRFHCCHFSVPVRKMADGGNCWFTPVMFCQTPKDWRENAKPFDMVCVQVGPMDRFGYFNLGPQVVDVRATMERAKCIVLEVNENMPYAHGYETSIHISDIDYVVEGSNSPLAQMPPVTPTEAEKSIARHVTGIIKSGSTIQLGIGGTPNYIGQMLCSSDIDDLSIHSEMLTDACVDLYEAGKISSNKNIDKGLIVYSFCGGTKRLHDFIHHNPICCAAPVDYVNAYETLSKLDQLVSINSCIQCDLYGQVNSESAGYRHISGTGGQLDFVLGALLSKGGTSVICLPSTRTLKDGSRQSLIVPTLPTGSIVSTPRSAVQHIATEFGIVNLRGKSTWQRAELLISIAHPDFHEELIKHAEKMGIWKYSSKATI